MITRSRDVQWNVRPDGSLVLSICAKPSVIVWPDGSRWRAAAVDDGRPGDRHPTLDEAKAAAMIIARNRVPPR
ncbi:MAG: hypothetical protein ACRC67_18120 [Inquilinus sp.]|uniref:hypothetical protein n=1 Tax=Inquilinus sp. TaxID=1932117 RepID=UPI003F3138D2